MEKNTIGNKILFWILALFLLFIAIIFPIILPEWNIKNSIVIPSFSCICILLIFCLYDLNKYKFVIRIITGIVSFVIICFILLDIFFTDYVNLSDKTITLPKIIPITCVPWYPKQPPTPQSVISTG